MTTSRYLIRVKLNEGNTFAGVRGDVLWFEAVQFLDDDVVFHEELTVLLAGTTPVERPTWGDGVFVERAKDRLFD